MAAQSMLIAGALLVAGLLASLVAGRVRLPGLLLFLGVGMALGSNGLGLIAFSNYGLARTIGIVCLAFILFEGGLASGFEEIRPVLRPALALAVVGTIATALLTGLVVQVLLGYSTLEGMLLGSVLAATDSAAIFALLRGSSLRRRLARTLEGEAGFNDPVAVLLVVGFIDWIQLPGYGIADMVALFARELALGAAIGLAVGFLAVEASRRVPLATGGLYPVLSVAAALVAYGGAGAAGGSGFLAVFLTGLWLGSGTTPARRTVTNFHQGLAWVAQIVLFLTLGLLVFPDQLGGVASDAVIIALVSVLVARPVAAALATLSGRFTLGERALLGWAGLRGGAPIVLGTFPVIAGVSHGVRIFDIVFFAVVISTLLQGTTFEPLARAVGVTSPAPALPRPLAETGTVRALGAEVVEYPVGPDDAIVGHRVRELRLPRDALVNVIVRDGAAIPPRGSTRLQSGDRLHVLVRQESADHLGRLIGRWRSGPWEAPTARRPPVRATGVIFTTRPWSVADGDPAEPATVLGHPVTEQLRDRRDAPGALVALADGRYAITGQTVAVGAPVQLRRWARQRLVRAATEPERTWWENVSGALGR